MEYTVHIGKDTLKELKDAINSGGGDVETATVIIHYDGETTFSPTLYNVISYDNGVSYIYHVNDIDWDTQYTVLLYNGYAVLYGEVTNVVTGDVVEVEPNMWLIKSNAELNVRFMQSQ